MGEQLSGYTNLRFQILVLYEPLGIPRTSVLLKLLPHASATACTSAEGTVQNCTEEKLDFLVEQKVKSQED